MKYEPVLKCRDRFFYVISLSPDCIEMNFIDTLTQIHKIKRNFAPQLITKLSIINYPLSIIKI